MGPIDAQEYYIQLGQNIRMFRKLSGMTQKQLAQAIQKSLACVSKYEKGDSAADLFTLYKIAQQLGVPMEQILPQTKTPAPPSDSGRKVHPMFQRSPLYLYWYRNKKQPLVRHVLEVDSKTRRVSCFMEVENCTDYKGSCKYMMLGTLYDIGPNIYLQAVNTVLTGDVMLLCFNPVDLLNAYMVGFLCCMNRSYHMTASKCFISSTPLIPASEILDAIQVTKDELAEFRQSNFFAFGTYRQE